MFVTVPESKARSLNSPTAKTINEKLSLQNDLLNLLHHENSKREILENHFEWIDPSPEELTQISLKEIFDQSIIHDNEF